MSEEPTEVIVKPTKLELLNQWKLNVETEINGYNVEREKVMVSFKKDKEKFDRLLGIKAKKMKKYDVVMNARKKVLADIIKEIEKAQNELTGTAS
jgi:hypothetical protein